MTTPKKAEPCSHLLSWIGWYDSSFTRFLIVILLLGIIAILYTMFHVQPQREQEVKQQALRTTHQSKELGCDIITQEIILNNNREGVFKIYCQDGRIGFVNPREGTLHLTDK